MTMHEMKLLHKRDVVEQTFVELRAFNYTQLPFFRWEGNGDISTGENKSLLYGVLAYWLHV